MKTKSNAARQSAPLFGGFYPLASLWDEAGGPLFPSEASARWFIRVHRAALAEAQAIAIHAGRTLIHRERFEAVAQRVAIELASRGTNARTLQ